MKDALHHQLSKIAGLSLAGAAGVAAAVAAVALTVVPTASAYTIDDLLAKGASVHITNLAGGCHDYKVSANGISSDLGSDCDASFQANLDAFYNEAFPPPPPPPLTTATSTAATTTTTQTTTTATTTTTTPTATTTAQAPAQGTASPSLTTTTAGAPTAAFTNTATGLIVTFTDASVPVGAATIQTVTFLFGDGANATALPAGSVDHAYTAGGTFTVVEFVTDSNGLTDRTSTDITVSPFGGVAAFHETRNPRLGKIASSVFRLQVNVSCVTSWGGIRAEHGGLGLSIIGSREANVAEGVCKALTRKHARPTGIQLLVLNHEAGHALGIRAERSADCYAWKLIPRLERHLGIRDHGQRHAAWLYIKRRYHGCRG